MITLELASADSESGELDDSVIVMQYALVLFSIASCLSVYSEAVLRCINQNPGLPVGTASWFKHHVWAENGVLLGLEMACNLITTYPVHLIPDLSSPMWVTPGICLR